MAMERYMVHTATGQIVEVDGEVLRRVLTQAAFGLRQLPDKTVVEAKAIDWISKIQFRYPELI